MYGGLEKNSKALEKKNSMVFLKLWKINTRQLFCSNGYSLVVSSTSLFSKLCVAKLFLNVSTSDIFMGCPVITKSIWPSSVTWNLGSLFCFSGGSVQPISAKPTGWNRGWVVTRVPRRCSKTESIFTIPQLQPWVSSTSNIHAQNKLNMDLPGCINVRAH